MMFPVCRPVEGPTGTQYWPSILPVLASSPLFYLLALPVLAELFSSTLALVWWLQVRRVGSSAPALTPVLPSVAVGR
jgi:hypothetical protein